MDGKHLCALFGTRPRQDRVSFDLMAETVGRYQEVRQSLLVIVSSFLGIMGNADTAFQVVLQAIHQLKQGSMKLSSMPRARP